MSALLRQPASVPALFSDTKNEREPWREAARRRRPSAVRVVAVLLDADMAQLPLRSSRRFAALAGCAVLAFEYPFLRAAASLIEVALPR